MAIGPNNRYVRYPVTYWAPGTRDQFGNAEYLAPVVIQGNWQDIQMLVRTKDGDELTSKSIVYTQQPLEENGFLAQGDESAEANPLSLAGVAWEIKVSDSSSDLRKVITEYRAIL